MQNAVDISNMALVAVAAVLAWTVRENVQLSRIVAGLKVAVDAQQATIEEHSSKFDLLAEISQSIAVIKTQLTWIFSGFGGHQPPHQNAPTSLPIWAWPAGGQHVQPAAPVAPPPPPAAPPPPLRDANLSQLMDLLVAEMARRQNKPGI